MLIAGCDAGHSSDTTAPGARSSAPARFALSTAVQSLDATGLSVNVFYLHGTQQVSLASTTVALPVTGPTSLSVDLSPCLTDPGRVPLAQGTCAISAELVLLKGTAELDRATVGPVDAKAGQDATLPQATLHEVSTVTIAGPSGGALSFEPETTVVLTATAKDATGADVAGLTTRWGSSNPGVATIDSISGAITTIAPGSATVTATVGGRSGSISVQVVPFSVRRVTVSGPTSPISVGQAAQLTAAYFDRKGRPLTGRTVSWSSSNTGVATVSSTGSLTGIATGAATITATVDTVSGTLGITVIKAAVASVGVTFASSTLHAGQTTQATATAFDAAGNPLAGRTVSNWSSSNPSVASVSATGVVSAISVGTVTISATVEGITGTGTLTVSQVPVATVTVTLASTSLYVHQTTGATAVARDSAGNVLSGRIMGPWQSSNLKVAQVDASGLITAVGIGTALISTTIDNVPGAAILTVTVSPVATVIDSLANPEIAIGETTQAGAVALSATGAVITGFPVTWTSSNPAIATVSSTGVVTGVGNGQATITATVTGVSGTTTVFVFSSIGLSP